MASTFSNLGINLQGTGDNSGTWGQLTNVNLQDLDSAIAGVAPITLTGNTTLAFTSNSSSTTYTNEAGRNKIIVLSGSLSATTVTVTVPNIQKDYVIVNNTGATVIVSSGGSTTVTIPTTTNAYIYSNGSSATFFALPLAVATTPGGTTNAIQYNNAGAFAGSTNLTFNGTTLAMQTATALNLSVTSLTIYSTINATSVVTSASLIPTGVTSGSYTLATITVGSDGRITSASSGSAGGKSLIPTRTISGPASGTHTASPVANNMSVYLVGGGGGGGTCPTGCHGGGSGGKAGYGFWNVPITQPYSQPYSVGGQGNGGGVYGGGGGTGGASSFSNVGTANGGAGGNAPNNCGSTGASGNAPGATYGSNTNVTTQVYGNAGNGGNGGSSYVGPQGSPGTAGLMMVYENIG